MAEDTEDELEAARRYLELVQKELQELRVENADLQEQVGLQHTAR